jgi:hypothetical protein
MLMSAILAAVWYAVWDAGQICNAGPYTEKRPNPQLGKNKGRRVAGSTPGQRIGAPVSLSLFVWASHENPE